MEKPKVVVMVRTGFERHHWVHPDLLNWLCLLPLEEHYKMVVLPVTGAPNAACSANFGAIAFMQNYPDAEWLCIADNDTAPPPDILRMLDELTSDVDIVGPMVHMLRGSGALEMPGYGGKATPFATIPADLPRGLTGPVDRVGGGCWFVRRRVLTAMTLPYFKELYDPETWMVTVSDDIYFQTMAKELGFKLYCDTRYVARHYHTVDLASIA